MIRPLTRTPRGKAGRYKPIKTLTIFWIFVFGLILSSSSALGQHPSEAVKRGFSVIGVPERLVNDYLICVGALVRLVKDDAIRTALLKADTRRQFLDALTENL